MRLFELDNKITYRKVRGHVHSAFGVSVWIDDYYEVCLRGAAPNGTGMKETGDTVAEAVAELKKRIKGMRKYLAPDGDLIKMYDDLLENWDDIPVVSRW